MLHCPPSVRRRAGCPTHVVPCAQPSARPRRESEACHAAAPHAPGTKAAARPRWHRRRRPRTRRAHFAARPVHVSGLAGFLVEVGERPRRGRVRRSRVDETISGLAVGHCGYAQPPASVVPALRAPPSRTAHTPFYVTLFRKTRRFVVILTVFSFPAAMAGPAGIGAKVVNDGKGRLLLTSFNEQVPRARVSQHHSNQTRAHRCPGDRNLHQ